MQATYQITKFKVTRNYVEFVVRVYLGKVTTEDEYQLDKNGDPVIAPVTRFRPKNYVGERKFSFTKRQLIKYIIKQGFDVPKIINNNRLSKVYRHADFLLHRLIRRFVSQLAAKQGYSLYDSN